jgi:ApaG protein
MLAVLPRVAENPDMIDKKIYDIAVTVQTRFLNEQSAPDDNRYVFAYTIRIANAGSVPARLLTRHWIITDANGKVQEVRGDGVVGEQPWLRPGDDFHYTSGAVLETAVGTMRGSYQMQADDGRRFDATIAPFILSIPRTVH